jgi:hypothetical protein
MDEARTTDAVEHLQTAARELIAAARLFLDAAEEVVEDPSRVREAADAAGGLLGDVVADLRRTGPRPTGSRGDDEASTPTEDPVDVRDRPARRVRRIDVE